MTKRKDHVGSILDPEFKYTPAAETDISKTFKRERARIAAAEKQRREEQKAADANLVPLVTRRQREQG